MYSVTEVNVYVILIQPSCIFSVSCDWEGGVVVGCHFPGGVVVGCHSLQPLGPRGRPHNLVGGRGGGCKSFCGADRAALQHSPFIFLSGAVLRAQENFLGPSWRPQSKCRGHPGGPRNILAKAHQDK